MKTHQFILKASVTAISFALAACGGGGGGGSSPNISSTPSQPGNPVTPTNPTTPVNPTTPSTPVNVPMPSANPATADSKEKAAAAEPITNKITSGANLINEQANRLNIKSAYDQNLSGAGVKVGVVDGSIKDHPAMPKSVVDHGNFVANSTSNSDHGTKVALVLSGTDVNGNSYGIAKEVEFHKANIGTYGKKMDGGAALRAWNDLRKDGVAIINNSWGDVGNTAISKYQTEADAYLNAKSSAEKGGTYIVQIKHLVDNNVLLVFGTGNDGALHPSTESLLPLAEPQLQKGLIAVTGIDSDLNINKNANRCGDAKNWCMAANWRMYVSGITATNDEELHRFGGTVTAGTSIAAPQVTGAAALVKQKYPWMSNDNLRTTLLTTATDLGAKGVDSVYGWGLLNIGKAVSGPAQFAFGDFNADVTSGSHIFSNAISGSGGLNKTGSGSLTLQGNHTFAGQTKVNQGSLAVVGSSQSDTTVNPGAKYIVDGQTAGVNNNGTFVSVGSGATVKGNYSQSTTGRLETQVGSVTKVTGNASLGGELHFTGIKAGYVPQAGSSTDVLTAAQVSGKFAKTTSAPSLLLNADTRYTANAVKLDIKRAEVTRVANTLQAAADADGIATGAHNLETAFKVLDSTYQSGRTAQQLSFVDAAARIQNITDKETLAKTLYSLSGSIYSNATAVSSIEQGKLNTDLGNKLDVAAGETQAIAQYGHTGNNWTQPGLSGKQSSNSGMVGAVLGLSDSLSLGGAVTYHNTNWTEQRGNDGTDSADVRSMGTVLAGRYHPANWRGHFLKGTLGYSRYHNDVSRTVWIADDAHRTGADVSGSLWQFGIAGGKKLGNDTWSLTPEIGLRYDYLRQDSFTEAGAEGYGLNAGKLNKGILVGTANLTGQYNWLAGNLPLSAYGNIGYEHDFQRRQFATAGGFADAHSNERAGAWQLPLNRWAAGVGLNAQVAKKVTAGVAYRYQGASRWHNHQANIGVSVKF